MVIVSSMYSIGSSIEGYIPNSSEDVLLRYATNATLGSALMAQAMWMRDTWLEKTEQRKKGLKNDRTNDV